MYEETVYLSKQVAAAFIKHKGSCVYISDMLLTCSICPVKEYCLYDPELKGMPRSTQAQLIYRRILLIVQEKNLFTEEELFEICL